MEIPPAAAMKKELLGISRSGRVRKKSSKLLFDTEDVEKKSKRGLKSGRAAGSGHGRGRPPLSGVRGRKLTIERLALGKAFGESKPVHLSHDQVEGLEDFPNVDMPYGNMNIPTDSDNDLDELVAGIVASGVDDPDSLGGESKVRHSLYMTEKANKRKMLKDGKVVTGKMERKDKGKSRYTAYSLWARESRKTTKFSKNQDLDFSTAARRLGELWSNVSNKEKNAWRRKAKIQATKAKDREKTVNAMIGTMAMTPVATDSGDFLTRATTSRRRKIASERQKTPSPISTVSITVDRQEIPIQTSSVLRRKRNSLIRNNTGRQQRVDANSTSQNSVIFATNNATLASNKIQSTHSKSLSSSSLVKIDVIDAAAHLKLLGENLSVIGDSLKEHDGQIASSGSLSVLLDSLLCSLAPLLCLTTRLPGLEKSQLKQNLAATLDNIAYVMPGL